MAYAQKLNKIKYIAIALLGITFVITIHEFGHFITAKLFNVKTPVFSIGFGPALLSKYIGTTKFQLAALPLGGYVSIDQASFAGLAYAKKMVIILAGIITNIIFAFIFYKVISVQAYCTPGEQEKLTSESDTQAASTPYGRVKEKIICNAPAAVKKLLKDQRRDFIGPFGIISLMGQSAALGTEPFLYFLALISLNIGLFNLLPVPFLDGGQALEITLKHLFNGPVPASVINLIYVLIFVTLYFLMRKKA